MAPKSTSFCAAAFHWIMRFCAPASGSVPSSSMRYMMTRIAVQTLAVVARRPTPRARGKRDQKPAYLFSNPPAPFSGRFDLDSSNRECVRLGSGVAPPSRGG